VTISPDDLPARLARCQRALDASQDGYWERDLRSQQIWYSPSFLALFGFSEGELSGERGAATDRVHPDDRVRFRAAYDEALRNDGRFDYEVRFLDASGQWRWVRGRGRAWFGADGQPEILCGSVADVHHRTTALNDLQRHRRTLEAQVQERTAGLQAALVLAEQRRQEAERANAAKSRFLAQMSHEIRTPLNGVMGLTELALRAAHSPEQRRYLEAARQSGQALLQVINDVLDFSRIESGHLALPSRPFDPAALLTETFRAVMPLARERQLAMMFDWFGDDGPLLGDESGLRQIVTNLLGNAIKFTETGHVAMVVEVAPTAQARRQLTIRVSDTGPGVPVEHRRRVFEPFEQADDQLARRGRCRIRESSAGAGPGRSVQRRPPSRHGRSR
jgi:PAS domain S-box-containing protein